MIVRQYPDRILYGAFSDTTSQTPAAINTPYTITMNTTDIIDGIYLGSPTSRIYCPASGVYDFKFSLQLKSSNASLKLITIWARIDGVDVPNSATGISLSGSGTLMVAAWNFVLLMNAGQYFELVWATDDTTISLSYSAAQTSPYARPAIPSVIMTVTEVT